MRISFLVMVGLVGLGLGTMVWNSNASSSRYVSPATEKWLDANHLQVLSRGTWQDVDLMPLADHMCQSRAPMFKRYCADPDKAAN